MSWCGWTTIIIIINNDSIYLKNILKIIITTTTTIAILKCYAWHPRAWPNSVHGWMALGAHQDEAAAVCDTLAMTWDDFFGGLELGHTLWLCQNSYGKSPFLMGKLTISMAIFNSYVKLPEGTPLWAVLDQLVGHFRRNNDDSFYRFGICSELGPEMGKKLTWIRIIWLDLSTIFAGLHNMAIALDIYVYLCNIILVGGFKHFLYMFYFP